MIITNQIKFDVYPSVMAGKKSHPDVGRRAKQLLRLYGFKNGRVFAHDAGINYATWNHIERGHIRMSNAVWPRVLRKCPGMALEWINWGNEAALDFEVRKRLAALPIEPDRDNPGSPPPLRVSRAKPRQARAPKSKR